MMQDRKKIRLSSWYWGAYVWENSKIAKRNGWKIGGQAHGHKFVEYNEKKDGWHNSEEYKKGQLTPYSEQGEK